MKKILATFMALILVFGLGACKPPMDGDDIDPNKTQIYVAIGDNGVGTEFLYDLKAAYEAYNTEVEIVPVQKDAELNNGTVYMKNATEDIVMMGGSNDFSQIDDYLMDLTDLVKIKAYDEDGEYVGKGNGVKTLEDKMKAYENNYKMFNVGTPDQPKFKSLPWFSSIYGLWYDIDLFNDENLFNLQGYKGIDGIAGTEDDFYGPDGLPDTYDDGLPATWEDMKLLLGEMKTKNFKPFTFSGMHGWMRSFWLDTVFLNYEGLNDYALNYSFNGTDSDFGEINSTNGYQLKQQEGRKAMLLVAEEIAKKSLYSNDSLKSTQTHLMAQADFLDSVTTDAPSAFLIDGNWWEYEARDTFDRMAKINKKFARGTRRFGYFPIPRFIGTEGLKDQINTKQYIRDISSYLLLVNKNTKVKDEVEDFLLFSRSETSLRNFTKTTNLFCAYDYDMSNDLGSLSPLARSVYDLLRSDDVEMVYSGSTDILCVSDGLTAREAQLSLRGRNNTFFEGWEINTAVTINGREENFSDPIRDMAYDTTGELNAESWFAGLQKMCTKEKWETYFR